MAIVYVRVTPSSQLSEHVRVGVVFTANWQSVDVDAATRTALFADPFLQASDTDPGGSSGVTINEDNPTKVRTYSALNKRPAAADFGVGICQIGGVLSVSDGSSWSDVGNIDTNLSPIPQYFDIHNLSIDEPLKYMDNLPSPYYPGVSKEHVYLTPVYIPAGFAGYKFWACANPYPGSAANKETPCIYCSNDGDKWIAAPGVTNPLFTAPVGNVGDGSLSVSSDGKTLYASWSWGGAGGTAGGYNSAIYISKSTNGSTWSTPALAFGTNLTTAVPMCPSVFWNNKSNKWQMIYFVATGSAGIYLTENASSDPTTGVWSAGVLQSVPHPRGFGWWHGHFIATKEGEIVGMLQDQGNGGGTLFTANLPLGGTKFSVNQFSQFPGAAAGGNWYKPAFTPICTEVGATTALLCLSRIGAIVAQGSSPAFLWAVQKSIASTTANNKKFRRALIRDMVNRQVKPGGAIAYDSFNRADSATTLGTSDSGHVWTQQWTGILGISGNNAYQATAGNALCTIDPGVSDFYAEVKLSGNIGGEFNLVFNYLDINNYWKLGTNYGVNPYLCLRRSTAVAPTTWYLYNAPLVTGDVIAVERNGGWITVYINDLPVDSIFDTTLVEQTPIGIQIPTTNGQKFDNLIVSAGRF